MTYDIENIKCSNNTQQFINKDPIKSDKEHESILEHIPEQNSIPILFKPKIENNGISNE